MPGRDEALSFQQIHIDVARNATDDFNPFHDRNKWHRIHGNPFGGPVVLGFQLEALVEFHVALHRASHGEDELLRTHALRFSNYQFTFATAVTCGQEIILAIKASQLKCGENTTLSNRVSIKADGRLALVGHKRETQRPLFLPDADVSNLGELKSAEDRAYLPDTPLFLKRKFMMNSNAKNFLSGSLAEQAHYFDELEQRVEYPEIFPCGLISCALLEKALIEGLDFERDPMVYTSHRISVDRQCLSELRSNDLLHILVEPTSSGSSRHKYNCYGAVGSQQLLFRAIIELAPLEAILSESPRKPRSASAS